jgi:hypothetical protein
MHVPSQPFDVITAFAVPDSNFPFRGRLFLDVQQVALSLKSLSLLQSGKILFKPTLFSRRRASK